MAECYKWVDTLGAASGAPQFRVGQCTFFEDKKALSEALGWVIVVVRTVVAPLLRTLRVHARTHLNPAAVTSDQRVASAPYRLEMRTPHPLPLPRPRPLARSSPC